MESSHRGLRQRVATLALEVVVSKSETQGQLSGCEGAIRSQFGLLFTWTHGTGTVCQGNKEKKRNTYLRVKNGAKILFRY